MRGEANKGSKLVKSQRMSKILGRWRARERRVEVMGNK